MSINNISNRAYSIIKSLVKSLPNLLALVVLAGAAQAGTVFWDGGSVSIVGDGNGGSTGGTGTWDAVTANWDAGVSPHVAWNNGNNDTAIFGGTAGTVALNEPITAGGLTFTTANYILTNSTLTLSAAGTISNTVTATIYSTLDGNVGLTKSGAGTLVLASSNNYTGGTVLNAGTLNIGADSNLGNTSGGITFNGSATIAPAVGGITLGSGRTITVNNGAMAIFSAYTPANITIAGPVIGAGGVQPAPNGGASSFTLNLNSTSNNFTGPLNVGVSTILNIASLTDGVGDGNINMGGGTLNYTGSSDLNLANRQIVITGTSAINSTTAATITIAKDLLVTTSGAKTLSLSGPSSRINYCNGKIQDGSGTVSLTVGGGSWVLNSTNTYSGSTAFAGTLYANSIKDFGVPSSFGMAASGAISYSIYGTQNIYYMGSGDTANRTFNFATYSVGSAAGGIYNNGTGPLIFTAGTFNTQLSGNNKVFPLTLGGTYTGGINQIQSVLQNVGALDLLSLTKVGPCTWMLSGANTYSGTMTVSGGGTLILNYTTQDNQKLANNKALTLSGGTVTLQNGSYTEVASGTTLNTAGTFLNRSGSSTGKINLNAISRVVGSTLDFADATIADTSTANANGILGGWATVAGTDWAVSGSPITAYTLYTALPQTGGSSVTNYTLTGLQSQSGAVAANTVKLASSGSGDTLDLGVNNLTLTSASATSLGGLLYVGGGDNNYTISGTGKLITSSTSGELIMNIAAGMLTLAATNVTAGATGGILTKTGAGTLFENVANPYTGATYVNQGALRLGSNTAAGTTAGGIYVQNGAALELTNNITVGAEVLSLVGSGIGGGGALRNLAGSTSTYGGAVTIGVGGARINSDAGGSLTLTSSLTLALFQDVTFGGAGNIVASGAIGGAGAVIKDGGGTLTLSGTNTFMGATWVNAGILSLAGGSALANGAVLRVATGAKVSLAPGVNVVVGSLYLDGQPAAAGTWGGLDSTAENKDKAHFTGTGMITVTTTGSGGSLYIIPPPAGTLLIVR